MLRSRFQSLPGAFNARLIPLEKNEEPKKGLKATLSRKFDEVWLFFIYYLVRYFMRVQELYVSSDLIKQRKRGGKICSIVEQNNNYLQR